MIVAASTQAADPCRSVRRVVITRSQDLRTIAPLREVLMSIEAVAPAFSGSFVYEGCYRPRGALTFAERSAWGLRLSGSRPSLSSARAPMRDARASACRSGSATCAQLGQHAGSRTADAIGKRCKRTSRFRVGCLSPAALRCAQRFASPHSLANPRNFARSYRLSVKVGGASATCIFSHGRSFVTGDMRPKARST